MKFKFKKANLPSKRHYGEPDGGPSQGSVGMSLVPRRNASAAYSADGAVEVTKKLRHRIWNK